MTYNGDTYLRAFCLSGMMNYTRYFFKAKTGKKFVVNRHHEQICDALDKVIRGEINKLIINIAPRYSKTEIAVKNFISAGLAINPAAKFIHLSYSDDLAHDNSEEIRDIVKSEEYQHLFPYVQIKKDSDSKKKWLTTAGGGVYAVATGGQVTGFGAGAVDDIELEKEIDSISSAKFAGAIVIDDPIKPEDALSDLKRNRVNARFENTIRNRVNSRNTPIIIIMQRLHEDDLCGYLQKLEPDEWTVLSIPCIYEDENGERQPLWAFKHTLEELDKIRSADPFVFDTQYMQNPTPLEGLLYHEFKTYHVLPSDKDCVKKNYTDTADTGSDYLCSICYVDAPDGNYVTDILYTKKPMEYTEPTTADMLSRNGTTWADIESNNGGRGFARNVDKHLKESQNFTCFVSWFTQSQNKLSRIFSRSADVNNATYFPVGWETRWSEFYKAIMSYRKEGKNAHDDAPDCLTGCMEKRKVRPKNKVVTKADLGL